jgi:coenzyme F420-reducing hydrogenase beta subunit
MLEELLRRNLVDAVVHVVESGSVGYAQPRFRFTIARTPAEVREGAKSRYSPVELSQVIDSLRRSDERIAFVALPCFAKALRLLCRQDELLRRRIRFVVGIFCGHLKSEWFGASLAWQCGVEPSEVQKTDFRLKLVNRPANQYGFRVVARDGRVVEKPMEDLVGKDWGVGVFKLKACDFCDDVVAETADVSVGDAWLPGIQDDWRGTNICVVRNKAVHQILEQAQQDQRLQLTRVDAMTVRQSQIANYRHRREELPYRLWLERAAGRWHPPKRVASTPNLERKRRLIQVMRKRLRERSHELFKEALQRQDLDSYVTRMRIEIAREKRRATTLPGRIRRRVSLLIRGAGFFILR